MSRQRSRIIALQAIVVSVLAVIVVVTLLKPEDSGLLSGVTVPGPGPPSPGAYIPRAGEHRGANERETGPAQRSHGRVTPGVVAATGAPATLPAPPIGAAPSTSGDGGGSPTDDQYADTLSRITERLN